MSESCLFEGWLRHRRFGEHPHAFRYAVAFLYADLAELPQALDVHPLWSARRPALAWLRRADHLGDPERPLEECVRELVAARTGQRPTGAIRLLTLPRSFGYAFNPVSFFFCFDESDTLCWVVADITNTPWGERHSYVVPPRSGHFSKQFHVSPFLPMDLDYDWRFVVNGSRLAVHMFCLRGGERVFDATLSLQRRELSFLSMSRVLLQYPAQTALTVSRIYAHALRSWLSGVPFHRHPERTRGGALASRSEAGSIRRS